MKQNIINYTRALRCISKNVNSSQDEMKKRQQHPLKSLYRTKLNTQSESSMNMVNPLKQQLKSQVWHQFLCKQPLATKS